MTAEHVREIATAVKVLCDIRLLCVLLMLIALPQMAITGFTVAALLATLPLSWLLLRHWEPLGARLIQAWALPAVESAVAILLFVSYGDSGIGAAYLAATLALLSCGGGVRPMVISLGYFAAVVGLVIAGRVPVLGGAGAIGSFWVLSVVVMLGSCGVAGLYLRRMLFARVELVEQRRFAELAEASSQERLRLAQDLHDGMSKTLHGAHLLAESLTRQLAGEGLPQVIRARELTHALDTARRESRELLLELREVPPGDLVAPCREQVRQWSAAHPQITLTQHYPDEPVVVGVAVQHEVVRTLGELLENVRRHSGSSTAEVRLEHHDRAARLWVRDQGVGLGELDLPQLQRAGHFGLVGVHERMERIGGSCRVESGPDGTTVEVSCPLVAATRPGSRT
ncbi:MAG: histidine kinase [Propionicimonas sp.]|nr:histidine kinase [Propionicimonas sp.]